MQKVLLEGGSALRGSTGEDRGDRSEGLVVNIDNAEFIILASWFFELPLT